MTHKLHLAVANKMRNLCVGTGLKLLLDPACGGTQQLPLFVDKLKNRATRMCCVDLLILQSNKVRALVEIEESGFHPTKICGKFLQTVLATHFIHDTQAETAIPYAEKVLFIQILDGSKFLKKGTQKKVQAELIEKKIQDLLPLGGITDYRLFVIDGQSDQEGFASVSKVMASLKRDVHKQ